MSIALHRANQRRTAQRALRAFRSDHQRDLAKEEAGDWIAALWVAFIVFLVVGGIVL